MGREEEMDVVAAHRGALNVDRSVGNIAQVAAVARNYFVALTTEGFSAEQALALVAATLPQVLPRM